MNTSAKPTASATASASRLRCCLRAYCSTSTTETAVFCACQSFARLFHWPNSSLIAILRHGAPETGAQHFTCAQAAYRYRVGCETESVRDLRGRESFEQENGDFAQSDRKLAHMRGQELALIAADGVVLGCGLTGHEVFRQRREARLAHRPPDVRGDAVLCDSRDVGAFRTLVAERRPGAPHRNEDVLREVARDFGVRLVARREPMAHRRVRAKNAL